MRCFAASHFLFLCAVVCLEEALYIHNIRDMKVLHTIRYLYRTNMGIYPGYRSRQTYF
jgi:hypothetical protein